MKGHKKGQGGVEGSAIFFLIFLILLVLAKAVILIALSAFCVHIIIKRYKSEKLEDRSAVIASILALIVIFLLVCGEFFPQMIDIPAKSNPQLCALHSYFLFPLSDLLAVYTRSGSSCYNDALMAGKSLSLCSAYAEEVNVEAEQNCILNAINAGDYACENMLSGPLSSEYPKRFCYFHVAQRLSDPTICDDYRTDDREYCLRLTPYPVSDVVPCEKMRLPLVCIHAVMASSNGSASCSGLPEGLDKAFCEAARNVISRHICVSGNFFDYPGVRIGCVAKYAGNESFCEALSFADVRKDCTRSFSQ
jgi:hypothetical protein